MAGRGEAVGGAAWPDTINHYFFIDDGVDYGGTQLIIEKCALVSVQAGVKVGAAWPDTLVCT